MSDQQKMAVLALCDARRQASCGVDPGYSSAMEYAESQDKG